ncbi:MAG TPA: hypothetical protein VF493_00440 [Terriglobales bacterium]
MFKYVLLILSVCWIAARPLSINAIQGQKGAQPEAEKLRTALAELQKSPADLKLQQAYLDSFPHTYAEFLKLFDLDQPLYDGHDYIEILRSLSQTHEHEIGKLLVSLSKDAKYEADAPSYLQDVTAVYGSEHPVAFAGLLKELSAEERGRLISFLADVEVHDSSSAYSKIISELETRHETQLANDFKIAKQKRQQRSDH